MTVSTSTNRADYPGNGVTTLFPVPFYFIDQTHLLVLSTVIATGVSTPLVLNSDYTVSGAGISSGGAVTTSVALASGLKLSILLNMPFTQSTHYVPNDPFPAASHEAALDFLTLLTKQIAEQASRSVQVPQGESGSNVVLPPAASRAGYLLGFDGSGALALVAAAAQSASALALSMLSSTGSTLMNFLQDGAGAILRSVQDMFRESVGVDNFSTVQQAVAQAFATGKMLRVPFGNHAATGNIPNLHDVAIKGSGAITRSGVTFYPRPTVKQTNNFYVDPVNGNDTNDGLTPDLAWKTSQRAFDVLAWYGPALRGQWFVNFASGTENTTTGATFAENLRPAVAWGGTSRIRLVAPSDLSFKVDGGGVAPFGWNFNGDNKVDMFYVVHQNCTTYGYVAQDGCDINDMGCLQQNIPNGPGSKMQGPGRWRKTNGRSTNCQSGASAIGNVVFTMSGWQSDHNTQAGLALQEGATGHTDNCIFDTNPIHIDAVARARSHALGCTFTNATTCHVRGQVLSDFYDNPTTPNTYDTTAPRWLMYSGSVLTATQAQYTSWMDQPVDLTFTTTTGTTSATTVRTYATAIPANAFESPVKAIKIRINGNRTAATGTHNVVVNVNGSAWFGFTMPAAASGPYVIEGILNANGQSAQSYEATCQCGVYMPPVEGSRSIAMYTGAALPITVVITPNTSGDSITVRKVQISVRGGGA